MPLLPRLLEGERRRILFAIIGNGLAQSATGFGAAMLARLLVDSHFGASGPAAISLASAGTLLILAAMMEAVLRWRERVDAERLGQGYVTEIRAMLFDHLSRVPARRLQRRGQGSLLLRLVSDMTALRLWVSRGIARLWVAGMMGIGVLAGLAYLSPLLAGTVATVLVAGALATTALGARVDHRVRVARRQQGRLAAAINETLVHLGVVQAHGRRHDESRRISRCASRLQRAMVSRASLAGLLRAISGFTATSAGVAVLWVGVAASDTHAMTRGTLLAALMLVALLATPLLQLGRIAELWRAARISREKLDEVLALQPLIRNPPQPRRLARGPAGVEFRGVVVEGALERFSATAEAGQRIAVSGPHGSGKSTLLALVPRLVEPDEGRILVGGRDVADLTLGTLRRAVAIVSPELPFLRGRLGMNLRYRKPDASADELHRALVLAGAEEIVAGLPLGLETRLSAGAGNLSYGERRRLMWARALLGNPRVLLLDDADANLDDDSRRTLLRMLAEFDGTVVVAAQQPALFGELDAVWTLRRPVPAGAVAPRCDGVAA